MSIHKSLKLKGSMQRARNVLTRKERNKRQHTLVGNTITTGQRKAYPRAGGLRSDAWILRKYGKPMWLDEDGTVWEPRDVSPRGPSITTSRDGSATARSSSAFPCCTPHEPVLQDSLTGQDFPADYSPTTARGFRCLDHGARIRHR